MSRVEAKYIVFPDDLEELHRFITELTPLQINSFLKNDKSEHAALIKIISTLPKDEEIQKIFLFKIGENRLKNIICNNIHKSDAIPQPTDFNCDNLIALLKILCKAQQKTILNLFSDQSSKEKLEILLEGDFRIDIQRSNYFKILKTLYPANRIPLLDIHFIRAGSNTSLSIILNALETTENKQFYLHKMVQHVANASDLIILLGKNHDDRYFLDFETRKNLVKECIHKFSFDETRIFNSFSHDEKKEMNLILPFRRGLAALEKKWREVNERRVDIDEFQVRDPTEFFAENDNKILLLYKCMGEFAFKWMSDQLAYTILPLKRLMDGLPNFLLVEAIDWLRKFFDRYASKSPTKDELENWYNILIGVSVINDPVTQLKKFNNASDLKTLSELINKKLLHSLYDKMHLSHETRSKIDTNKIFSQIPMRQFSLLAKFKRNMGDSDLAQISAAIIDCYLIGKPITDFLHNQSQSSNLGQALATHNQNILKVLLYKRINPITALSFRKTYEFSYEPPGFNESINYIMQCNLIISMLKKMQDVMHDFDTTLAFQQISMENKKIGAQFFKLQKYFDQLSPVANHSQLLIQPCLGILRKIQKTLIALLKLESIQSNFNLESFRNASADWSSFQLSELTIPEKHQEPVHFRIEQWDKEKISTLFLGNEVGCCLAIGSDLDKVIIERIMDDAMLFHVVINMETKKPIALTWAYLAINLRNEVILIGNFVEIKAKYATNQTMHRVIIDALLHFSGEIYCKDNPNIKGFFIKPLTYGFNQGMIPFSQKPLALINKVGGAFSMQQNTTKISERQLTCEQYYLQSLQDMLGKSILYFHCYNPDELSTKNRASFIDTKTKIIQIAKKYAEIHKTLSAIDLKLKIHGLVKQEITIRGMNIFFDSHQLDEILNHTYDVLTKQNSESSTIDYAQPLLNISQSFHSSESALICFLIDAYNCNVSQKKITDYLEMIIFEKKSLKLITRTEELLINLINELGITETLNNIEGLNNEQFCFLLTYRNKNIIGSDLKDLNNEQLLYVVRLSQNTKISFQEAIKEVRALTNINQLNALIEQYLFGLRAKHLMSHTNDIPNYPDTEIVKNLIILARTTKALEEYNAEINKRKSSRDYNGLFHLNCKNAKTLAQLLHNILDDKNCTTTQKVRNIQEFLESDTLKASEILTQILHKNELMDFYKNPSKRFFPNSSTHTTNIPRLNK